MKHLKKLNHQNDHKEEENNKESLSQLKFEVSQEFGISRHTNNKRD